MHTYVDYTKLPINERRSKALTDLMDWLGHEKFWEMTANLKGTQPMPLETFEWIVGISGASGYPVTVWYQEIWPNVSN